MSYLLLKRRASRNIVAVVMKDALELLLCLPAVARLAQRLEIRGVPHELPVAPVWNLVVHVSCYSHKVEAQAPLA